MGSEIGPCPVCGAPPRVMLERSVFCTDAACGFAVGVSTWQRLADAARLAAAVARLEGHLNDDDVFHIALQRSRQDKGLYAADRMGLVSPKHVDSQRKAKAPTLAAALVALEGEVGE